MTFQEAINKVIKESTLPAGQGWVTLAELIEKAKELDGIQKRRKH